MTASGPTQANIATPASALLTQRRGRARSPGRSKTLLGVLGLTLLAIPALETGARAGDVPEQLQLMRNRVSAHAAPLALIENRRVLSYPFDQVWPTAIRYLRIDRDFEITDRDPEAGFLLFQFPLEGQRIGTGSLEMFATEDASGRPSVSMSVNTGAGPVHLPNSILDGIAAKVRAERGQPLAPPRQDEPEPPKQDDPNDDHSVPLMPPSEEP